jgi:alternate signal-mediated exported protein
MNSKLVKASLAGAAAIALAAGGGTFAAWSDFGNIAGTSTAGALKLSLSDINGTSVTPITSPKLAPGENKVQDFFVASRSDDTAALQNAALSVSLADLVGIEDGCTTNSESAEDVDCSVVPPVPQTTPPTSTGDFPQEAYIQFSIKPATSANTCATGGYASSAARQGTLAHVASLGKLPIGSLNPGDGVCVRMELGLPDQAMGNAVDFAWPNKADNKVQGDSATFNVRFDLEQV